MLFSDQDFPAADLHDVSVVIPTPDFQMRRTKNVKPQLVEEIVGPCDLCFLQQARVVWMTYHLFNDRVASARIGVRHPKTKCVGRSTLHLGVQVSLFFMEKRFTVGGQILQVSELRAVDGWKVRLGNDALEDREPDSASTRIGSSNTVFVTVRPAGFETRPAKSHFPASCFCHLYPPRGRGT